ncbi:hypothetical protein HY492_01250 [Candidatus Woesearchaeota archaeon]|nr:hypothetical protein [Candidatus Woesearchaeota archaeon]
MTDQNSIRDAENAVRDLKNWIFVFAKEHNIPKDAVDTLHEQVDNVAKKIANIK